MSASLFDARDWTDDWDSVCAVLVVFDSKMLYYDITMHTTNLRRVGGSIMLAVPPVLLDILHLRPGATVGLTVKGGRLLVEPQQRPHYTLRELLAQCNPKAPRSKQDREWVKDTPVGNELI